MYGKDIAVKGLSPPVRGNRDARRRWWRIIGSIPARAGKPVSSGVYPLICGVYPRPCGETSELVNVNSNIWGLSPPVRGNR